MILISILFYSYIICILALVIGFNKIKDFNNKTTEEKTTFSVIIPFRNEEKNLPKLLESISSLIYSKDFIEFIFVDDDSTDNSVEIINYHFDYSQEFSILKNERTSNSPKKDAISIAIKNAKNNWIITTDADCELPKNWIKTIDAFIQQNKCNMVVAPVSYKSNSTFFYQFQRLDFMSLQATTIGGFGLKIPFLANGANFIYKKSVFEKVNGFEENNSIASGDDVFLLEKFLNFDKRKVKYLKSKNAIVETFPVNSFSKLIQQRVRWASKTANYKLAVGKLIGVLVLVANTILALAPFMLFFRTLSFQTFVSYFLLKLFFDYLLLERMAIFENKKIDFTTYFKSSIVYPYFFLLVFLKSFFSNYQWKERTFKK
jgi:cellulose synthase/poly-beta-1,6-N-acetylglucosamine synthase-like glycosyltransferase